MKVRPDQPPPLSGSSYSQTLSKGVRLLELLAEAPAPATLSDLASTTGFGRTVTHRLLRTLAAHRLVTTTADGRYTLGFGLVTVTRGVARDLTARARPVLARVANTLDTTVFLGVADGDEVLCLISCEPGHPQGPYLSYREGLRHPMSVGATGRAILSTRPPGDDDPPAIEEARRLGYARSATELTPVTGAVAVPVTTPNEPCWMAITAIHLIDREVDEAQFREELQAAALQIAPAG